MKCILFHQKKFELEYYKNTPEPDNTAVRTALWRALHIEADGPQPILEDEIGLQLIAPNDHWRQRPDMHPEFTKRLRASIVARARFIEDLIIKTSKNNISQYVILGAGLDTFAQRRPEIASQLQIFEIDQPDTQIWKQHRLMEVGYDIPKWLHFVSVDFEVASWWSALLKAGFDITKPAVVACTGVTLYLTKNAIFDTLKQIATLASGSQLAMAFYLPMALIDPIDKPLQEIAEKGAATSGTPFVSFFSPEEVIALATEAGFKTSEIIDSKDMEHLYFKDRIDDFRPASGELFLDQAEKLWD